VRKPIAIRTHREELQTFVQLISVHKSGGRSKDRKHRTKTYQQVYQKWIRVPYEHGH